jgi:outer membrane lipase/esterase
VAGNAIFAHDASSSDTAKSSTTTGSFQLGADYRLTPHFLMGAVIAAAYTDAKLDANGGKATVETYTPGVYASFLDGGFYLNALGMYGYNAFDEHRAADFGGFSSTTASAHPNGSQEVADFDGGYDFHAGALTLGPTLGAQYVHVNVDGFTENGGGIIDLSSQTQSQNSLRGRLGGRISYAFKAGSALLTPHLNASFQREFLSQNQGISEEFTSFDGGPFTIDTPNSTRNSGIGDLGLDADFNRTVSIFVDYLVQAGQNNYLGQSAEAGVKLGF